MPLFTDKHIENIPRLYKQRDFAGENPVVHLKVSLNGYIWLITEYLVEKEIFYGYIKKDAEEPNFGYISRKVLKILSQKFELEIEKIKMPLEEAKAKYI